MKRQCDFAVGSEMMPSASAMNLLRTSHAKRDVLILEKKRKEEKEREGGRRREREKGSLAKSNVTLKEMFHGDIILP